MWLHKTIFSFFFLLWANISIQHFRACVLSSGNAIYLEILAILKLVQNAVSSACKASIFQVLEQTDRLLTGEAHQTNW